MKKLKIKFKRALFAFLKEEILNVTGYNPRQITAHKIVENRMEFHEIKGQIYLPDNSRNQMPYDEPIGYKYQDALKRAKKEMFEAALEFIKVDVNSIVDPRVSRDKEIKLSLFVGTVKTI